MAADFPRIFDHLFR